eukprot:15463171-Alexandrium_andersonii.AAC.1
MAVPRLQAIAGNTGLVHLDLKSRAGIEDRVCSAQTTTLELPSNPGWAVQLHHLECGLLGLAPMDRERRPDAPGLAGHTGGHPPSASSIGSS